ncbi:zinc finger protein Rlf isoform X7 [Gopherus evgoodei]|uniref:zinc finger protein Rlf isoform X7 n=1 Tax=Gopherus evgoodei TaxID=1825980 RepID=UPI0011CF77B2|nr:zinc finger protein Rlf isoform X7 [Gopherus evgoodei]
MADAEAEASPRPAMERLVAALRARLWQLQEELREQEVSESSSRTYCRGFCQTLLQYAGNRGATEHILPFLEVYRISIQSFANARPYLTTECEDVLLVLGRLVLYFCVLGFCIGHCNHIPVPSSRQFMNSS